VLGGDQRHQSLEIAGGRHTPALVVDPPGQLRQRPVLEHRVERELHSQGVADQ
jgi:hypothetical protein